jgi:WXG100 family type VII secretion target
MSIFGDIMEGILEVVREIVEAVQNQVNQLIQRIANEALAPVRGMVNQVLSGIWKGRGADAFVDMMNSQLIPQMQSLSGSVTNIGGQIGQALNIMDQADRAAQAVANELGDLFGSIF